MSTFYQVRSVVELTNQGWEALRFPDRKDITLGANIYMANDKHEVIVVDGKGDAYRVDMSLETAKSHSPIYKSEAE